jgi:hypothetical protein
LLRTGSADLIKAAGVLRQSPTGQAGHMCADRFYIVNRKLAKGVWSIHVAVRIEERTRSIWIVLFIFPMDRLISD